jgi:uncharacterized protein
MAWALVTGASGGIGRELAKCCARDYDVILVARSEAQLRIVAGEVEALGRRTQILVKDLTEPGAAVGVFDRFGQEEIGALINNAGFGLGGNFVDLPIDRQMDMLQLNVAAPMQLSWLFAPQMLARKSGRILNIASTAAFQSGPGMAVYFATKACVLSLSGALHEEFAHTGVSVTALCPGPTATHFSDAAGVSNTDLLRISPVMSAKEVARIGYDAMRAGKPLAIAGLRNRIMAFSTRLASRQFAAKLTAGLVKQHRFPEAPSARARLSKH